MSKKYPRLFRRQHIFYMRIAIPRDIQTVALRKEFIYSLMTTDYLTAIRLYHIESVTMDKFITLLRIIAMKVSKRIYPYGVEFENTDIDDILVHRLEEIIKFCEDNYSKIKTSTDSFSAIRIFNPSNTAEQNIICGGKYIYNYLLWLYRNEDTHVSVKNFIEKIFNNQTTIPTTEDTYKQLENENWFRQFMNKIVQIEDYGHKMIADIELDRDTAQKYEARNPLVRKVLAACQDRVNRRLAKQQKIKTLWTTLFEQYKNKKIIEGEVKHTTLDAYKSQLDTIFSLIEKKCVEDITAEDCQRISVDIYRVPKKWRSKYKGRRLNSILRPQPTKDCLSKKTVVTYLVTFLDFLTYAMEEEIISTNFSKKILIPKTSKEPQRIGFDKDDLLKIFNPATYPDRYNRHQFSKFWIPIISLYTGCRANEISQLRVNDIIKDGKIYCFNITDEGDKQSVKNKSSIRKIPIHPVLLDLGFVKFVERLKANNYERVFHNLTYTKKNQFAGAITHWFARYLDKIGIKASKKVFHSFRYTFEEKAIERNISTEVQNALGGWTNKGTGQAIYGKRISTQVLFREIKKIRYPFLNEYMEKFKEIRKDFSTGDYELSKKKIKKRRVN